MEAKAVPAERLDGLDAERFRQMLDSPPFALLRARIVAELERAREACVRHDERSEIFRAQGTVSALRAVIAMPDQILKEIEAPKTSRRP